MKNKSIVLGLALAGCSLGSGGGPDVPDYYLDTRFDIGMAQIIGDVCTSARFLDEAANARDQAAAERLVAEGQDASDITAWLASDEQEAWADERTRAYLTSKGVDPDIALGAAEADVCRIADEEIAAASGIGQLLEKV